jgi:hypothetical protein
MSSTRQKKSSVYLNIQHIKDTNVFCGEIEIGVQRERSRENREYLITMKER